MGFLDTDAVIVDNEGCSIETIVARYGWDYFRASEKRVIEEISKKDNHVIATGGGAVMDEENVKNLKRNGWVVWLNGKPEIIRHRMGKDTREGKIRPSLTDNDPLEEIKEILDLRAPFYERAADLILDASLVSQKEVSISIIKALPKIVEAK